METCKFEERTIEIEQQLVAVKNVQDKVDWIIGAPKSVSGNRTITFSNTLVKILKQALIRQKQNQLKYGEHYKKSAQSDFVCKKENGEHCTPS
jgi:hypothetical protein